MPKQIHLVQFDTEPGGIEVLLPNIVKNMPERTFSVFALRAKQKGLGVYDNMTIPIQYGSNANLIAFFKFFRYAFKNRKDIFHVLNIGPVFLFLLRLARAKAIVYGIHGTIYWKSNFKKIILRFFWQKALNNRIAFLANSQHSKNEFLKKINPRINVKVLYNPMDIQRFSPCASPERHEKIRIVYTGRLENGKNLPKWIEVAAVLHSRIPNTFFELYGAGSLTDTLQQQINELGASGYIQLKGFRKDIEKVYRKADLLLFLSEYESFGNVVAESILCGTPVIASPIPAMSEIFSDYPEFLLNENDDIAEQVYNKLTQLNFLKERAQVARRSFMNRFSLEQHINSLREVYSTIE